MTQTNPGDVHSDAPLTAAKHQRDVAHEIAEQRHWDTAALAGKTVTVNRPRQELYEFWRDFRNLARFMENIERVEVSSDDTSHWVVKAPADQTVEWDSVLTEDRPGEIIAWTTPTDAQIRHTGRIEFREASPGRGTEVSAVIEYEPPAGELGKAFAKLFQKEPKVQARHDLRRFKQLMETGEIPISAAPDAAPRGG